VVVLRQSFQHRQEIYVALYGEVQKQVIEATLATEYGLVTGFRETTPIGEVRN